MEAENRLTNKSQPPTEPISQPHFDDEATLLSARPVIPLKDLKEEGRPKPRLFFALAIMISLLFGAFTATLISYLQHAGNQATIDNTQPAGTSEQTSITTERVNLASSSMEANGSSIESDPTTSARKNGEAANLRKSRLVKNQTPPDRRNASASSATSEAVRNDSPDPDGREPRRERSEARRRMRAPEHKNRKTRNESSDDLLRIGEIFEGAPRP